MNRDEIQSATPQELRVRVAMLMGWKQSPLGNWPWQMVPPEGDGTKVQNCPNYPITWEAAGQVMEKMSRDGYMIEIESDSPYKDMWTAMFLIIDESGGRAWASTGPAAISKAALTARALTPEEEGEGPGND